MTLITALRILGTLVACVLGPLIFYTGEPSHLRWWIGALPFALWLIGPAVAPCLIANHKSRQWFSITMLLYFAASSIFSGLAYYDAFCRSRSSTAALTLVFIRSTNGWRSFFCSCFAWVFVGSVEASKNLQRPAATSRRSLLEIGDGRLRLVLS
jgi:hypothetical protein